MITGPELDVYTHRKQAKGFIFANRTVIFKDFKGDFLLLLFFSVNDELSKIGVWLERD